jgi:hypothetical protein
MSSTAIWSIAGIIATVVIGWLFYRLQKTKKYPGQLSYTILNKSKVIQRVPGSFNKSLLKYNDYSVSQELHYIEVMVFNPRTFDVGNPEVKSKISVSLPSSAKWVDVRIKEESPEVDGAIEISPDSTAKAELSFKMLKENDYIIIEGLVESISIFIAAEKCLLSFFHRIPNVDVLKFVPRVSLTRYKSIKQFYKMTAAILLVALTFFGIAIAVPKNTPLYYCRSSTEDIDGIYRVSVNPKDMVEVRQPGDFLYTLKETITYDEFESRYVPFPYHVVEPVSSFVVSFAAIIAIFIVIVGIISFENIKDIRHYNQLKKYGIE